VSGMFGLDPSAIIGSMGSAFGALAPAPAGGGGFQPAPIPGASFTPAAISGGGFQPAVAGGGAFAPAQIGGGGFGPADIGGSQFAPADLGGSAFGPSPGQAGGYVWGNPAYNPLVEPPKGTPQTGLYNNPGTAATYTSVKPEVARWAPQVQQTFGDLGGYVTDAMMAIIQHESQGDPAIQNRAGYPAYGLFQLWEQPGLNADQQFAAARKLLESKLQVINASYARLGLNPDDRTRARDIFLAWSGQFDPGTAGPSAARDVGSGEDGNAYLYGPNGIMPMYDAVVAGKRGGGAGTAAGGGGLIDRARTLIGTPYSLGGLRTHPNQPNLGLDCSEYTAWVYQGQGVQLPWNAQQQFNVTQRVDPDQLQPGDLVFFYGTNSADPDTVTHVGMYTGNGKFINSQDGGVQEVDLNSPYWQQHYYGAGRVVAGGGQPPPQGQPPPAPANPRPGLWG
jgi:cell wall-associated NlpC family hydrolase